MKEVAGRFELASMGEDTRYEMEADRRMSGSMELAEIMEMVTRAQ
jgi:hypothetical protein